MSWTVHYLHDKDIIFIKNKGISTYKDYEEQTKIALEIDKKYNKHLFLSDCSESKNIASILEIYNLPSIYEKSKADRKNKLAVIVPKSLHDYSEYKFFENICQNRGRNARLFHDKQNAIKWLQSD